jgi:hypothetical protein
MTYRKPCPLDSWPGGFECDECGGEIIDEYRGQENGDIVDDGRHHPVNDLIDRQGGPGFHAGRLYEYQEASPCSPR